MATIPGTGVGDLWYGDLVGLTWNCKCGGGSASPSDCDEFAAVPTIPAFLPSQACRQCASGRIFAWATRTAVRAPIIGCVAAPTCNYAEESRDGGSTFGPGPSGTPISAIAGLWAKPNGLGTNSHGPTIAKT